MPKRRLTIKDTQGEIQLFTRRILAISLGIGLLVLLLFARLVNLQLYHHQMYVTLSQKNQLNLVPIEPNRGLIYDRNGVLLAENIPVFSLEVIPQRIKHHIKSTLATLGKIITLTPENLEQFDKQLKQHTVDLNPFRCAHVLPKKKSRVFQWINTASPALKLKRN
jgi:penicillin-binding protein 2